jgi:hypothetical protein
VQLRARGWPLPKPVLRLAARIMRLMIASDGEDLCKQLGELQHHLSARSSEQRSELHVAAKKLLTLLLLSQKPGSQLPHSCSVEAAEELLGRIDCNCFT